MPNFRNIPLSQNHVKENNTLMVRVNTASLSKEKDKEWWCVSFQSIQLHFKSLF